MGARFDLGSIEVRAYCDGLLKTSIDFAIGIERAAAEAMVGGTDQGSLFIPVNNFLFRMGEALVMVDAGAGKIMQPTLGALPDEMQRDGFAADNVTHIVITHIHSDHTNGLLTDDGAARYKNAQLLIHPREYEFWMMSDEGKGDAKIERQRHRARLNLAPYAEQVRLIKEGEELAGCTPHLAPGHTPGHCCWRIGTGRNGFLAWGDLVHFSDIQIEAPDVAVTYDLDPDLARRSRLRFLDMMATEGLAVAGAHVASPGLGYIKRKGRAYSFEQA
jgi:glyoxylase-like metal-dependent hydrolase (beta-lactamase superfamily II)